MKKLLSIFCILISVSSLAQFPNNPPESNIQTNRNNLGAYTFGRGMNVAGLTDTTAWNVVLYTKSVAGMIIRTTANGGEYWYRNTAATGWIKFSSSGGSAGWALTGNAGTTAGINFLGTTDNVPLVFKVKDSISGIIDYLDANTSFGYRSLRYNSTGTSNNAFGLEALLNNTTGSANIAIGPQSLAGNTTGVANIGIGSSTLYAGVTTGNYNIAIGHTALINGTTGDENIGIGYEAFGGITSASNNIGIGGHSLASLSNGLNNVAIGGSANVSTGSVRDAVSIGFNTLAADYGVAMGSEAIAIEKQFALSDSIQTWKSLGLTSAANDTTNYKPLGINSSGIVQRLSSWQGSGGGSGWGLTGNAGTTAGTNFLGTTDNVDLVFKINNTLAGRLNSAERNTFLGYEALLNDLTGGGGSTANGNNTAVGYRALYGSTTGFYNTAFGTLAMGQGVVTGDGNVAIGKDVIRALTSGSNNTGVGNNTMENHTTGSNNTGVGGQTLAFNTTGSNNTAGGFQALFSNTTGSGSTAFGYQALRLSTTTSGNSAFGRTALTANTTGAFNTAIGDQSLVSNTTGTHNVGVGYQSLFDNTTGLANVGIGALAINNNTTGEHNIGIGYASINANTTASHNIGIGYNTLLSSNADGNIAIGREAQQGTQSGVQNIGIGTFTLRNNTTGEYNTASGYNSLLNNTTGLQNTAFGSESGKGITTGIQNTAIGVGSLQTVTTGNNNTALGSNALGTLTTGHYNIGIGDGTVTAATNTRQSIAIGYTASAISNQFSLSDSIHFWKSKGLSLHRGVSTLNYVLTDTSGNGDLVLKAASGGVSSLAAIGSSPNANGATISGSTLNLEPASASFGGVVTTGTQTFAGTKTITLSLLDGRILVGNGSNVATAVTPSGDVTMSNTGVNTVKSNLKTESFGVTLDGAGGLIATGTYGMFVVPFDGTITGWEIAEVSGTPVSSSIVVDVWKDVYANYPPTVADAITGSEKPTLSSATINRDLSLSTWTTSVTSGDIIRWNVDSITSALKITLTIFITRT